MWTLYKKELLELVRDKKTLFFAIAMPLLIFPLLFGGIGIITAKQMQKAESEELKVAITRPLPMVTDAIRNASHLQLVTDAPLATSAPLFVAARWMWLSRCQTTLTARR